MNRRNDGRSKGSITERPPDLKTLRRFVQRALTEAKHNIQDSHGSNYVIEVVVSVTNPSEPQSDAYPQYRYRNMLHVQNLHHLYI